MVTTLDMRGNDIRSGIHLADMLSKTTSLKTLSLEWNFLGEDGIHVLAEALCSNTTLTQLDLRNNRIGPDGAASLARMLEINRTLMHLDLRWNAIESSGAAEILATLRSNTVVRECQVSGNEVPIHMVQQIEAAVAENSGQSPVKDTTNTSTSRFSARKENLCDNFGGDLGHLESNECSAKVVSRVRSELHDLSTKYQSQSYERTELAKELEFARSQAQVDAHTFDHERQQLLAQIELQKESLAASDEHIRRLEQSTAALTKQLQCDSAERDEGFRTREHVIESKKRELEGARQEVSQLQSDASSVTNGLERKLTEARELLEKQKAMHSSEKYAFQMAVEEREANMRSEFDDEIARARTKFVDLERRFKLLQREKQSLSSDHETLQENFADVQSDFSERVDDLETKLKGEQTKRASAESRAIAEVASKIQTVRDEMKVELERRECEYEDLLEKCAKEQAQIREWLESEKTARNEADNALRTAHRDVDRSESALVQSKHRTASLEEAIRERERHAVDVRHEHKEVVERLMESHGLALSERESTLHQKEQRIVSLQQRVRTLESEVSRMAKTRTSQEECLSQALAAIQRCFPSVQQVDDFSQDRAQLQPRSAVLGQLNQNSNMCASMPEPRNSTHSQGFHSETQMNATGARFHPSWAPNEQDRTHIYADTHSYPMHHGRSSQSVMSVSPRARHAHTHTPSPSRSRGISRFRSEPQLVTPRTHSRSSEHAQLSPRQPYKSKTQSKQRSRSREKDADAYGDHAGARDEKPRARSSKSSPRHKPTGSKRPLANQEPSRTHCHVSPSHKHIPRKSNDVLENQRSQVEFSGTQAKATYDQAPTRAHEVTDSESDISFDCVDVSSPRLLTGKSTTNAKITTNIKAHRHENNRITHGAMASGNMNQYRPHTLHKASTMANLPTLAHDERTGIAGIAGSGTNSLSPAACLTQSLSSDLLARTGMSSLNLESVQNLMNDGRAPATIRGVKGQSVFSDDDGDGDFSVQSDDDDGNSEFSVS